MTKPQGLQRDIPAIASAAHFWDQLCQQMVFPNCNNNELKDLLARFDAHYQQLRTEILALPPEGRRIALSGHATIDTQGLIAKAKNPLRGA